MTFTICALAFHAICNSYVPQVRTPIERLARAGPTGEATASLALDRFKVVEPMGTSPPGP
jgi:hypothetical protein